MAATAGYQAGIEANQTQLSIANEVTWGVRPAVAFQAIRYMSDTLALTKTRQRPGEINITREVSQAVTTQQASGGSISYALSYGTYDEFFSVLAQNDWTPKIVITSTLTDITATNGTGGIALSSTTANKFAGLVVGQWVRMSGWTLTYLNNWFKVYTVTDATHVNLAASFGVFTETSTTTDQVQITASTLNNGVTFKSLYLQRKFSASKFLRYGGVYVTRITLGAAVGSFFTGAIDVVAQSEVYSTTEGSTGAVTAAPAGAVFEPIAGYARLIYKNSNLLITGLIDQLNFVMENTGAAPEFSMGGSAGSDGILGGTFTASGSFRMYCKDFAVYDMFQRQDFGDISFFLQDKARASYVISFQEVVFLCKIQVGGPGQAVYVQVDFECNPDPTVGGTFQMDRHPAPV